MADFDGNSTGDADLNLDKWYARLRGERTWAWLGRNSLPWWKQNELFLDDDVIPVGLAAGGTVDALDSGDLSYSVGYFTLPVGMQNFAGHLAMGQLVVSSGRWAFAGGLLAFEADPGDRDASRLLAGNGLRDYTLWTGSMQVELEAFRRKLTLGSDFVYNSEDYPDPTLDPIAAAAQGQTEGIVLSASLGGTRQRGDWLVAYYYAEIEALAVNSSYAQDDWVRWGSAVQGRSSDFSGHEIRFAYAITKDLDLMARAYFVESLSSPEDGERLRLDLNYRF